MKKITQNNEEVQNTLDAINTAICHGLIPEIRTISQFGVFVTDVEDRTSPESYWDAFQEAVQKADEDIESVQLIISLAEHN